MITYQTRDWLTPLFYFHKADTFRKLWKLSLGVGLYAGLVAWLEIRFLKLPAGSHVENIPIMHSLLGFAISMLLVFRTNTAYDRWWEGRKLWGSLVNNCRNLAVKLDAMLLPDDTANRIYFRKLIHIFCHQLSLHLQSEKTRLGLDENPHPEIQGFDHNKHIPTQVVLLLQKKTQHLYKTGVLSGEQQIVLNPEITSFLDICGGCERIKNTPIPYSYSTFIKKFIAIYVLTLPFGFVFSLGVLTVPVVMFIFYVLASLEVIAEEIEDPFGGELNDLPMDKLAKNINGNVQDILG